MADPIRLEASAKAHALSSQEWQQLLAAAEKSGSLRQTALAEILDQRQLDPEGCQNPGSARNPSFDTLHG